MERVLLVLLALPLVNRLVVKAGGEGRETEEGNRCGKNKEWEDNVHIMEMETA